MFSVNKFALGMLFIGAGLGGMIKEASLLPSQISFLGPYLTIVFLVIGVWFLISQQ